MLRKIIGTLVLSATLLWLSAGIVQAQTATPKVREHGSPEVRKSVLAAVERWRQAVIKKDRPELEAIFDDDLSYGHTTGEVIDKAGTIERALDPKQSFSGIDITDETVRAYRTYALVTHKIVFHVVKDGKATDANLSGIDVWVKSGGRWRLRARQLTRLPQPAA